MNQDAFDKAAAVVLQEARARLTKKAAGEERDMANGGYGTVLGRPPQRGDTNWSWPAPEVPAGRDMANGGYGASPLRRPQLPRATSQTNWSWSANGPATDYNPAEFHLSGVTPPPAAGPGLPAPAKAMPAPGRAGLGNLLGRFGGLLSRGGLGGGLARLGTGLAAGAGLNALNNYMRPGPVKAGGDVMFGPEDNPERPGESTLALGGLAGGAAGATVPDMLRNATSQAIPAGEIRNPGMAGSVPYGKDTNVSGMYRLPVDSLVERMNPSTLPKFRSMSLTERLGLVGDKLLGRTVGGPNTDMSHVHPSTAENMRQMHYLFDNGMSNSASLYARDIVPHATMGATGKSPLTDGSYPPYDVRKTIAEGVRHATPAGQEPRRSVLTGRDFFGKIQPKTLMGNISQFGRNLGKSAPAIAASTGLGWLLDKIRNAQYNAKMTAAPEKAAHALLQEARYRLAVKQADMDPALRNALLGAALGGGAGFAYDRLARDPKDRNGLGSAIAGAGLGAAGGAASPAIADALAGALGGSAAGGLTGAVGGAVTGNELRRSGLPASIAAPGGAMAGAPVGGVIGGATGALTGGAIGGLSGFANAAQQDHAGAELLGNALGGLVLGGGVGAAHEMTKDKKDRNLLRGAVRGGAIGAAGTAAGTGIGRMLAGGLGGAAGGAVGGGIAGTAAGGVMGGIAGSASDQDILEARAQLERTLQQYRTQHGS